MYRFAEVFAGQRINAMRDVVMLWGRIGISEINVRCDLVSLLRRSVLSGNMSLVLFIVTFRFRLNLDTVEFSSAAVNIPGYFRSQRICHDDIPCFQHVEMATPTLMKIVC